MSERDTLSVLAEELSYAFSPLGEAISSPENFNAFMRELGWNMNLVPTPISAFAAPISSVLSIVESGEVTSSNVAGLVGGIKQLVRAIEQLASVPSGQLPATVNAAEFKAEFPEQLIQFLVIEYLLDRAPAFGQVLKTFGVIRIDEVAETATRPAYLRLQIAWQDLANLFDDPFSILRNAYQWNTVDFKAKYLLQNLEDLFEGLRIRHYYRKPVTQIYDFLVKDAVALGDEHNHALFVPVIENSVSGVAFELGVSAFMLPRKASEQAGFAILPYGNGEFDAEFELGEDLTLGVEAAMQLSGGIGILVRPDMDIEFLFDIIPSGASGTSSGAASTLAVSLKYQNSEGEKTVLLGSATGSRLEFTSVSAKGGVRLDTAKTTDVFAEFDLKDGGIVINAGDDSDSFLSSLLPEDGFSINFSLVLGFSTNQGFYFGGSGGLEVSLPIHIDLGVIEINSSTLAVKFDGGKMPVELGTSITGNLGPLKAVVENMGLMAIFSFPGSNGNLGPINLDVGFKPPNGVGLAIDAGVVKGGGFLRFNPEKEEYDGVLELDLSGIVAVKAIGLISTKLPDGSKGFSLLIILTAEFGSPIQLGFGFTLSGVGGLLGLNRTMRLEVIAMGIRDGGINSIMFPQNVVANAPRIISDLKKYFPVEEGTFLIGPMVKIGWGTPNLVTVSLGIIIEINTNTSSIDSVAILGVLKVALPDKDAALIVIQASFIGAIEFDKKRLWFFASLFESRVLFITLEGAMGLLVGWGSDANFVVSVGGFHPAFNPPPLPFGGIARIAISILNTDFARIRVEGYFAVTSNSVQFGAAVEIFFGVSAFNIDGHLAFDALFRFSPFYFIISISASLSVKVFGIGLFSVGFRGSLEGPTPWHVEGTGSISILFWDIDVDFSHTWGNEAETTLPPISVLPLLGAEYKKLENWRAVLPINNQLLVSLRSFEQGATDLVLHPVGSLKISQRAVPLELTIDKVGNQKPSDANRFSVTVSSTNINKVGDIEESIAVGQYFVKSDHELLSAKSFEPMKCGLELSVAGEQYHAPVAVKRVVRYEKIIIDTQYRRFFKTFFVWFGSLFSLYLNGNAVSKSALSQMQQKKLKPFEDKVAVGKTLYTVAFNHDNSAFNANAMSFTSQVQAQEYMKQQIATDANLAKQLHVIPQVEMRRAA
jgi:hypothetical protein